ncbi:RHS repeat-associated core domain-containing protein [Streptomyces sp. NPDC059467]|uniref:RHS repeat-associated core domain-containing protein n=1 Tax=Streptomyces sp. NPDC059467 TaxID=3346844 RepID=UPI0036AD6C4F
MAAATSAPVTSSTPSTCSEVGGGYSYDACGPTTAVPGSTRTYYADDLAYQQTAGTNRQTWQLDAGLRFRSWTIETNSSGTWSQTQAKTNRYSDDSDNPNRIVEDTAATLTRNVTNATGSLTATTGKTNGTVLQLSDIHGDISPRLPLDTVLAPTTPDNDENGATRAGQSTQRYGRLGGKQRSSETLTGLTLMGVRLYDPITARFLQTDPVFGGNCNAYDALPGDPSDHRYQDHTAVNGAWSPARRSRAGDGSP